MSTPRSRKTTFQILPSPAPANRSSLPPHLTNTTWLDHESNVVNSAFADLKRDLKHLKKDSSAKQVHVTRVTLRRWFSVWKVLRNDGWQSNKYKNTSGSTLKKLQKLMGALRDIDVNLEFAEKFAVGPDLTEHWQDERQKQKAKLKTFVQEADFKALLKKLHRYIDRRSAKIGAALPRAKAGQSAYNHLEFYLIEQETITKDAVDFVQTPEQYHQLRLHIKSWRYLLTEFFGLTNLELVRAQQLLGQLHDIDRLTPLLTAEPKEKAAADRLAKRRAEILPELTELLSRLPYGLRPQISSSKARAGR